MVPAAPRAPFDSLPSALSDLDLIHHFPPFLPPFTKTHPGLLNRLQADINKLCSELPRV